MGENEKKLKNWHVVVIVIVIISLIYGFLKSSKEKPILMDTANTTNKSSTNTNPSSMVSSNIEPLYFTIGQTAKYKDIQISFNKVKEVQSNNKFIVPQKGNIFLQAEFTIQNDSKEDLDVSSILLFDMYVDNSKKNISFSALSVGSIEGTDTLDGTIAPGKKMTGSIGLEVPANYKNLEFYYKISLLSNQKIIFKYNNK